MGFNAFSWEHFSIILFYLVATFACVFCLRKANKSTKKVVNIILFSAILFFAFLEYIGRIVNAETFNLATLLPIETIHIFAYVFIYIFISKRSDWRKFAYLIVLPVLFLNILFMPNYYLSTGFSLATISYVVCAICMSSYGILGLFWGEADLFKKDIISTTINYAIFVSAAHIVNVFIRFTGWGIYVNYMATMGEDYDLFTSFLYSIIPVPFVWMVLMFAIIVGLEFLLILPFDLIKGNKMRQHKLNELIALGNVKAQQQFRQKETKEKSQVIVRNSPNTNVYKDVSRPKDGFVAVTKEIKTNKDHLNK